MSASNYLENKVLDHVLKVASFSQPAVLYLGLFTGSAGANLEAGVITDEVSGNNYSRVAVSFSASASGVSATAGATTFPVATASWGTITHVAILDSTTGGNVLFWGELSVYKAIDNGDIFQIGTGNLTVTLT